MGIGIGGRADANGSGSSAHVAAPVNQPRKSPAHAGGTPQPSPNGSTATAVPTNTKAGIAGVAGGPLPPAEPDVDSLAAGARKGWASTVSQVPACTNIDIDGGLMPWLNQIAHGSSNSNAPVIQNAVRAAGDLRPNVPYLQNIPDPTGVSITGHCIAGIFGGQAAGDVLVRQLVDDDQLNRIIGEVIALSDAIAPDGGLSAAFASVVDLGNDIHDSALRLDDKPTNPEAKKPKESQPEEEATLPDVTPEEDSGQVADVLWQPEEVAFLLSEAPPSETRYTPDLAQIARAVVLAQKSRAIVYHAAEWVLNNQNAEGDPSIERVHRLAQLVRRLINESGKATTGELDRNLFASVVIACAQTMDTIDLERLEGLLEGMVMPPDGKLDKWNDQIHGWFRQIFKWISAEVARRNIEAEAELVTAKKSPATQDKSSDVNFP